MDFQVPAAPGVKAFRAAVERDRLVEGGVVDLGVSGEVVGLEYERVGVINVGLDVEVVPFKALQPPRHRFHAGAARRIVFVYVHVVHLEVGQGLQVDGAVTVIGGLGSLRGAIVDVDVVDRVVIAPGCRGGIGCRVVVGPVGPTGKLDGVGLDLQELHVVDAVVVGSPKPDAAAQGLVAAV